MKLCGLCAGSVETVQVELRATGQPVSLVFFGGSNAIHLGIICGVSERWILGPSECPGDLVSLFIISYYHFLASQPQLNVHAAMMLNLIHENRRSKHRVTTVWHCTFRLPTVTIEESRSIETQAPSKASGRQPVTLASHPSLPAYPMQECHKKFDIFTRARCGHWGFTLASHSRNTQQLYLPVHPLVIWEPNPHHFGFVELSLGAQPGVWYLQQRHIPAATCCLARPL